MVKRSITLISGNRDFSWLMAVQFCAQAGDGLVQTALAKYVVFGGQRGFDLEGARSPDELLRIALYLLIPYTILSPFIGVIIDRWDRRRLLFIANGARAVILLGIGIAGTRSVGDLALFLAFLLTVMSTRAVLATKAAALPATLDDRSLVEGNAISQLGGAVFQLGGAAVALVGAGIVPVRVVVVVGAVVYAAGAGCAWVIGRAGEPRPTASFGEEVTRVIRNIVAGVKEVARVPKAGASIATYFWLRLLWSLSLVGIGLVARELLSKSIAVAALTGGAGAVGAVMGFLAAERLSRRVRTTARLVLASSALAGAAVVVLGGFAVTASLALLALFLGFGFFLAKISLDTMVQEALGDDFRGRAFSLYDISYNLAWLVAASIMYVFWSERVQGILIAATGAVFLIGLVGLGAWFRSAGLLATTVTREEVHV